jgi:hypothetical protein
MFAEIINMKSLERIVNTLKDIDDVRVFAKRIGAETRNLNIMREVLVWVIKDDLYELKKEIDIGGENQE